jgi:hypothetical protein
MGGCLAWKHCLQTFFPMLYEIVRKKVQQLRQCLALIH